MVGGKRYNQSLKLPKEARKEAIQVVKEYWLAIARGELGLTKKDPSIQVLFDSYIDFKKTEVTPRHLGFIEDYLHRVVAHFGDKPISEFSASDFLNWLNSMDTRRTAELIQIETSAAFSHAVRMTEIEKNPLENVPKIKHRQKTREPLSRSEFVGFGRIAQGYSCGKLLLFLMKTGCRFSEAALATWQKIDLDGGEFRLRAEDTKTRKPRTIGLSTDLCVMLNRMKPENADPFGYVFLNREGRPFNRDNVRRTVKKIGSQIGRPDICTHSLRHSFTTLLRDSGTVQVEQVQRRSLDTLHQLQLPFMTTIHRPGNVNWPIIYLYLTLIPLKHWFLIVFAIVTIL